MSGHHATPPGSLRAALRRRRVKPLTRETYQAHALIGEAYSARMYGGNPELSPDAVEAYRWAERQFNRIARGEVGERDLIG